MLELVLGCYVLIAVITVSFKRKIQELFYLTIGYFSISYILLTLTTGNIAYLIPTFLLFLSYVFYEKNIYSMSLFSGLLSFTTLGLIHFQPLIIFLIITNAMIFFEIILEKVS